MTLPNVNVTELDGALGVLPPSSGKLLAVVGPATSGPFDTPSTFARAKALIDAFGAGPAVEAAAYAIDRTGKPVVFVRTKTTTDGIAEDDDLDHSGVTGTSVPSVDETTNPIDDFDLVIEILTGGTIGTDGIIYRYSLDGGRTWSAATALGTATEIVVPGSGGVTIDFAAGTLVAGDTMSLPLVAPAWSNSDLTDALTALGESAASWEVVHIVGPMTASALGVVDGLIATLAARGKYRWWIGNTRRVDVGETEAAFLTAMSTAFGSAATVAGAIGAGDAIITSALSGRSYRRPIAFAYAARQAAVSEEINVADVNLGPLPGVLLVDDLGRPIAHDEALNPGLDDARFVTLRTWEGIQGVYVTRPRLLAPSGSDFEIAPYRRVINIAKEALRLYLIRRLHRPIRVSRTTGLILERDARDIEIGGLAVLRALLGAQPKASDWEFVVSRTDNLLSTKTLTVTGRIIPLGYPEFIDFELGLANPAVESV